MRIVMLAGLLASSVAFAQPASLIKATPGAVPIQWLGKELRQIDTSACRNGFGEVALDWPSKRFRLTACRGFNGPTGFANSGLAIVLENGRIAVLELVSTAEAETASRLMDQLKGAFEKKCQPSASLPEMFAQTFVNCGGGASWIRVEQKWKFPAVVMTVMYALDEGAIARMSDEQNENETKGF